MFGHLSRITGSRRSRSTSRIASARSSSRWRSSRPRRTSGITTADRPRAGAAGGAHPGAGRRAGDAWGADRADQRDVWINSVHVVCGALVLATSLSITLRSWRVRFAEARPPDVGPLQPDTPSSGFSRTAERASAGRRAGSEPQRLGQPGTTRSTSSGTRTCRRRPVPLRARAPTRRGIADYVALTKPRLNFLVVLTSAAGYYLGATGRPDVADGAGGGRHRARRRRRGRAEPGLRARHRRADAPHAPAAAARRPRARRATRGVFGAGAGGRAACCCSAARANLLAALLALRRRSSSISSSTRR